MSKKEEKELTDYGRELYNMALRNLVIKTKYTKKKVTLNINIKAINRPEFTLLRYIFSKFVDTYYGTS